MTPEAPLYATRPGRIERSGGQGWRWVDAASAGAREIDGRLVQVAAACDRFAPIAQHALALAQQLGLAPDSADDALRAWLDAGIGVEAAAWFAAAHIEAPAPLPEPLLVIRAYERPQGLRRLLDSIAAEARRHGARHHCLVVDDTVDPLAAQRTRDVLAAFPGEDCASLRLLGLAQREAANDWLLDAVPAGAREALRPLLDPARPTAVTGSRTWNWAVLAAAGRLLSILDDDVSFPLRRAPDADARVQPWDTNEADTRYYDEPQGWRALAELDAEPYAFMGQWLGRAGGAAVARHGFDPASVLGRRPAELALLRDASVIGVVPGIYGGIAFDSSAYLAYSNRWSQQSLWQAPFRPGRLDGDNLWHGVRAPRLVSYAAYTPLLLDARELLPFAGTWGRVDDTCFLMLLRAIAGPLLFAHLPVALGHVDLAPRRRLERALQPLLLDRNAFIADLYLQWSAEDSAGTRAQRLLAVGERCGGLAAGADADLRARVLDYRARMMGRLAVHLEAALERHPEADAGWREIATGIAKVNRAAVATDGIDGAELQRYRAALAQAAAAAPHWPALWQRMRDGRPRFEGLLDTVR